MPQGYRFGNHGNPFLALLQTQGSVCQLLFSGRLQSLTVNELFFPYYEQDILLYRSLIKDGRQDIQFRVTKLCALCLPSGSQQITTTFSGTKLSMRSQTLLKKVNKSQTMVPQSMGCSID